MQFLPDLTPLAGVFLHELWKYHQGVRVNLEYDLNWN
jgi:hypothetical protein